MNNQNDDDIHDQVELFFNLGTYGMVREDRNYSEEGETADKLFEKIIKEVDRKWKCGLLLKRIAFERLKMIENKMNKDEKFDKQCKNVNRRIFEEKLLPYTYSKLTYLKIYGTFPISE